MHAAVVADHERLAGTVDAKIADGRAVLAEAAARLSAARERVAAIERGEAVAGGLGKPLDIEAVLRPPAGPMTTSSTSARQPRSTACSPVMTRHAPRSSWAS